GFDQKYAQQIFTMFQRLHETNSYAGTGIGLALCKKIVQNYHGAIYAEGKPNEGATFHVILPEKQPRKTLEIPFK
ncbi:MAG: sensor histidine kinase, partial [Bacteroidia bacterium]